MDIQIFNIFLINDHKYIIYLIPTSQNITNDLYLLQMYI